MTEERAKSEIEMDKKGVCTTVCQILQKVEARERMSRYRVYITRL